MKKLLARAITLALVFTLAACGEPGKEGPTSATAGEDTTTTQASPASSEDTATTAPGDDPTQPPAAPAASIPTDMAGIIRYYNGALARTPMRRTVYRRAMTKVTVHAKALGIPFLNDQNLQEDNRLKPYVYFEEHTDRPSDLPALEADWVKGAKSSVSGSTATLAITLRNHELDPSYDPKPGTKGYVSILDKATIVAEVTEIAMAVSSAVIGPNALKEVAVLDSSFGQCDGQYIITIDTDTGRIKGLTFTGTQFVEGNVKCVINIPLIPASAIAFVTMRGNVEGVYAPK